MTQTITTSQQLADTLWARKRGETYLLVGTFPATRGGPKAFDGAACTFDCTKATFTGDQYWGNLDGLTMLGGHYVNAGLRIGNVTDFSLSGATFDGGGSVQLDHGQNVTVKANIFNGGGVSLSAIKGAEVTDNTFNASIVDCIDAPCCQNLGVRRNKQTGTATAPGAHPDFLQSWDGVVNGYPMTGWEIEDNDVHGLTQGLFLPNGVIGRASRNKLACGLTNAIAVGSGTILTLDNNAVSTVPNPDGYTARIYAYPDGQLIDAGGNTVNGQPWIGTPAPKPPAPPPAPIVTDPNVAALKAIQAIANKALA